VLLSRRWQRYWLTLCQRELRWARTQKCRLRATPERYEADRREILVSTGNESEKAGTPEAWVQRLTIQK
jgi:hypothetical protein